MKPLAIDLFSGCGGLTLGLKRAGFRVVAAIDNDPLAVETYRTNHQDVEVWSRDISTLPVSKVMRRLKLRRGQLDLLAGCPPCQGFSTMATLNGPITADDPRNNLVFEFVRFVRGLLPKAVMLENVPGLAKDKRIEEIVAELEAMGYRCKRAVLNAANFGVPQRRRRFILLAGRRTEIPFARLARRTRSVRETFRNLRKCAARDPLHLVKERRSGKVMRIIRLIPKDGGSRTDLKPEQQLKCHRKCDGFKDVYGRMAGLRRPYYNWRLFQSVKGAILAPGSPSYDHPPRSGVTSDIPSHFFFSLRRGKSAAAQMIGNALPPEFVRRHAKCVLRFVRKRPTARR